MATSNQNKNWNISESIVFRRQKKYPEYNNINNNSENEAQQNKPKSKWINDNNNNVYPDNDPAHLVLYDYGKGKNSCMPYVDESGKEYFVIVQIPRKQSMITEDIRKRYLSVREKIHNLNHYYNATTFPDAPDGIYTWILGDDGRFLAGRVRSILEMGTIHKQLADVSKTKHIFVGGECKKEGNVVHFNIQSGTFSLAIIRRSNKSGFSQNVKQQRLQAKGEAAFQTMGLTPIFLEGNESLINSTNVPITKEELIEYLHAGFDVLLYEKQNECKSDLFSTKYPRAIRMQEGGSFAKHTYKRNRDKLNRQFYTRKHTRKHSAKLKL